MVSGLPKTVVLTSEEIRQALEEPLSQIIDAVKETLDRTPPELASDIMDRGIMLAGGGSLLQGLDERLREETQMPSHLAESPLTCVAVGSGRSLEEFEVIHRTQQEFKEPAQAAVAPRPETKLWSRVRHVRQDGSPTTRSPRAARRQLPDPPHRLFRRVRRRRAAHVQRGILEVVSPIQEGASRALKPVRDLFGWVGDTVSAKGDLKDARYDRDQWRSTAIRLQAAGARERAVPRPARARPVTEVAEALRAGAPRGSWASRRRSGTPRSRSTRAARRASRTTCRSSPPTATATTTAG